MASLISLPPRLCASSIHRIVFLPRRPPASACPPSRSSSIAGFSFSAFSFSLTRRRPSVSNRLVGYPLQISEGIESSALARKESNCSSSKRLSVIPRCSSNDVKNESTNQNKTPFGYTRKDVLLIGVGVTVIGVGLKSGLEFYGVDPLQAGNVVQLVIVLGLTVGWISTYMFRVSNKEMTYAQQLRDYEKKVMEKRLESLSEAELAALLEQVEEEKQRISSSEQVN